MLYWVHLAWTGFKLTKSVVIGTDCIIFFFAGASNVWEKSHIHKVSGIDLNIHVIEQKADMSNVIEENMVFVRGMKQTTSKDCLMDYLEVKAGLEPTDMSYGSDETCALVVFEDKIG